MGESHCFFGEHFQIEKFKRVTGMGVFLRAAYTVLLEHGAPLTAQEIVEIALRRGFLSTKGATPAQTMKSKLSTNILRHGSESLFMRSGKGRFALRGWNVQVSEFTADRFQKALFDEDIIVFPAEMLHRFVPRPGLWRTPPSSAELRAELRAVRRREAEEDTSLIQLVSVFIIRHQDRVLTYKRTKRLPESRLHDYYSLGFGGHLNPDDVSPLFDMFRVDQFQPWLMRELKEEVKFESRAVKKTIFRGLLYDKSKPVSRQHLGVTYEIIVGSEVFEIGERGFLMDAKFESVKQIQGRRKKFENWSLLLLDELGTEWK